MAVAPGVDEKFGPALTRFGRIQRLFLGVVSAGCSAAKKTDISLGRVNLCRRMHTRVHCRSGYIQVIALPTLDHPSCLLKQLR